MKKISGCGTSRDQLSCSLGYQSGAGTRNNDYGYSALDAERDGATWDVACPESPHAHNQDIVPHKHKMVAVDYPRDN
jgi:hypothetical protein